jgi:enoyl-CoA hydratase
MTNVQAEARDGVHVIRIDDGKVNALSPALVQDVHGALDEATDAGHAVLLCGRPGFLSAGFDLKVMRGDPDERAQLVAEGRRLLLRLFAHERPVVVACTGNAIAAGAGLLMAADWRVGALGEFKLGFNEVAIGHVLSAATIELARYRMTSAGLEGVVRGDLCDPEQAVAVGLLDQLAEPAEVEAVAQAEAARLAALAPEVYGTVKGHARRPAQEAIDRVIAEE